MTKTIIALFFYLLDKINKDNYEWMYNIRGYYDRRKNNNVFLFLGLTTLMIFMEF